MGGLEGAANIIDIPVYGQNTAGKLPGQRDPGTFDFTVTMNFDNTLHTTIRDDAGTTQHTFVIVFDQNTNNRTYAAFDGFIAGVTVNQAIDGAISMDVSIARSGEITWVDNT